MSVVANILDPVHHELDPDVWDDAGHPTPKLKERHRKWIINAVTHVLQEAGYTNMKTWLHLVLTGSLTTYQYGPDSDVDVSLFVDSEHFPEWSRAEMIGVMVDGLDGKKLPGTTHVMQCFVVPPGVTKEMLYKPGLRSGYDLYDDLWIVPPDKTHVHDVQHEMNAIYVYALECADKMERLLRYEPDKAVQYWHMIHKARQRDQRNGKGDFSLTNVVYKFLAKRNLLPEIAEVSGEYIAKTAAWDDHFINGIKPIAHAYDQMPHFDPAAVPAWQELAKDSKMRADALRKQLNITETDNPEPYPDHLSMFDDINKGNFVVSRANSEHPVWTPQDNVNFRIVHDVLGHHPSGGDFGWEGENKACGRHFQLLNPLAQQALMTECLGQTGYAIDRGGFGAQKVGFMNHLLQPAQQQYNRGTFSTAIPERGFCHRHIRHGLYTHPERTNQFREAAGEQTFHYHVSPQYNRESIATDGIRPGLHPTSIYAFDNVRDARDYALYNPKLDVYSINSTGLPVEHVESEFPLRRHQVNSSEPLGSTIGDMLNRVNTYRLPGVGPERVNHLGTFEWQGHEPVWIPTQQKNAAQGDVATIATQATLANGGVTINLAGQQPSSGYAFPPSKSSEVTVPVEQFTPDVIAQYISAHKRELEDPDNYLGTWIDNGLVYLDISQVLDDEQEAFKRATDSNQIAMWDIANNVEVPVMRVAAAPIQNFDVDNDAVEQARATLGLKHPVNVSIVGGTHGQYMGFQDGAHQVNLVGWLKPESASKELWEEMTHAAQFERDPNGWHDELKNYWNIAGQGHDAYTQHPWEVEAKQMAESHPFSLVRPTDVIPTKETYGSVSQQGQWKVTQEAGR